MRRLVKGLDPLSHLDGSLLPHLPHLLPHDGRNPLGAAGVSSGNDGCGRVGNGEAGKDHRRLGRLRHQSCPHRLKPNPHAGIPVLGSVLLVLGVLEIDLLRQAAAVVWYVCACHLK